MKRELTLQVAPPALSPGTYVLRAYADHLAPSTKQADVEVVPDGAGFRVDLHWKADKPVRAVAGDPGRFVDGCALLVPTTETAQAMTMGGPNDAVEAALWRADRERLYHVVAHGWGTTERSEAPTTWNVASEWKNGVWHVTYTLGEWAPFSRFRRFAVAVWQGAASERAGLKSITPAWVALA